jgi:hypothetical protein
MHPHKVPPEEGLETWLRARCAACPMELSQGRVDRKIQGSEAEFGHSNVPSNVTDRSLDIRLECQRRQYKLYLNDSRSTVTGERYAQLELLDFDWNPRNLQ